jgi:lysophospholipase L1-like esterase
MAKLAATPARAQGFRLMFPRLFACFLALTLAVHADEIVFPPAPLPAGTPIDAYPAPRLDQLENFLHHIYFARGAAQSPDLILEGDSITDFWQADDTGKPVWKQNFGAIPMIDFAIAGDRTQHVLWRLSHGQLDGLHPKLVEIMIGTNNVGNNTPQEIADGIRKIVETYRAKVPDAHILLLAIFPRGANAGDGARKIAFQVNDIVSRIPWDDHVTYLDIGAKFLQPDGTFIPGAFRPDNVHPLGPGYQIWADAVKPIFDQYCPVAPGAAQQPGWKWPTPEEADKINATLPTMNWPFVMTAPAGTSSALFEVPHADWFYRFVDDQKREAQGPYDFVMDGDSITDFWQAGDRGVPVWKQRFANIKVLDNAISGDQVEHVLWRVQHGDLDGLNPKLIMLMIGTNDGGRDPKGIAQGIRMILDEYEKRTTAHILLLGVFPRDPLPTSGARAWIKNINSIISTYGSDPRVTYMDIGDKFLQPDGTLTKEIMPDFLHPSTKGYQIWADAIQPVIDQYFPNAAAPKTP